MILRGLFMLAKGERAGMQEFSPTTDSFAMSMLPLIALPTIDVLLMAVMGDWHLALLGFFWLLDAALVLPVLVYEFARLFRRREHWLRTATALNWSFWMIIPATLFAILINTLAVALGLMQGISGMFVLIFGGLYVLIYRWFVLCAGLSISGWRAALILLALGAVSVVFNVVLLLSGLSPDVLTAGG
jgi:hypothetical protein